MSMLRNAVLVAAVLAPTYAWAGPEICGNDIDDDGNGLTDEGCYPSLTTGVCESPLSCGDTGMVSWTTGSLHYDLPPDIAPAVPFGPGIGFRRFYTPSYSPAGLTFGSVNEQPLGPGWGHTYMTWLDAYTVGPTNYIVLHTSQGRDVLYTETGACGSDTCYAPQAGDHVMSLKYDPTNLVYYVQLLTGETLKYNAVGQIIEIWDNLQPTPNKVLITWDSTTNGNVSTVTDASGQRRLLFTYTNNLLTSLQFQINTFSGWTTEHTTTYDYSLGVARDATSGFYVPADFQQWETLLTGTGIASPTNAWGCQEASGSLSDFVGSSALSAFGTVAYNQTVSGWSRKAVVTTNGTSGGFHSASSICNPATTDCTALAIVGITNNGGTTSRDVLTTGDGNGARAVTVTPTIHQFSAKQYWNSSPSLAENIGNLSSTPRPWIVSTSHASLTHMTASGAVIAPPWATGTSLSGTLTLGAVSLLPAGAQYLYAAAWNGTSLTSTQLVTLFNRIENGPGILSSVTIGGQLAQTYTYSLSGYLARINDASGNPVNIFSFSSTVPGQVDLITTPRGTVGFDYNATRSGCMGDTILYFNTNGHVCTTDANCSAFGSICGGTNGTANSGRCFVAGRCMTTSTANGEEVVTNITPLGPGGPNTCSGACADVAQYSWSTAAGLVNVIGRKDATTAGNFTSATYNSNGLPTQIGYGDTDNNPTNGGTNRTEYYFYDAAFPGRLAEVRRPSDISSSASSCSSSSTTGCERLIYTYDSTTQQLKTIEQDGYTLTSAAAPTTYSKTITYSHDPVGRISEIDGAVSGTKTTFDYYPFSTASYLTSNALEDSKSYTDATHYLEVQILTYDFWGHPTIVESVDGNYRCDTYDTARGFLAARNKALDGNPTCGGTNLNQQWQRDSWLRLTNQIAPDKSCVNYQYDTSGRLSVVSREDFNTLSGVSCANSNPDAEVFTYTPDSQIQEIDTELGATKAITRKQEFTYYQGRQLSETVNPASSGNFTGFEYDPAGRLTEIDGDASLSKKVFHFDSTPGRDNRITSVEEYKTSSSSDTWSLLYSWMGEQAQVTDGDSKLTGSTRDDLGRVVKITSPDLAGPTIHVFDADDRLTTIVEDEGGGTSQQTHTFTFDLLGRPLNDDYQGTCLTGTPHPEIQRAYDVLPTGVTCPALMPGACSNTAGRLAWVEVSLMCSSTYSSTDGSLDQFTFYAYDDAGRVKEEYITDDSGRVADHKFSYVNNHLHEVTTPSAAVIGYAYGSSGSSSDDDVVTSIYRGTPSTPIVQSVVWNPFGPLQSFAWLATISGTALTNVIVRDLNYDITEVKGAIAAGVPGTDVVTPRDALRRVTSRSYSPTPTGLTNSFYLYDEQSRVTCETTTSVTTCPTTGSGIKNNHSLSPPFMSAGDWKQILRPVPGSTGGLTNNFNSSGTGYGGTHQITDINQSDGTPAFGHTAMAYDARGEREYDDNTTTLTNDRRDYTYDARHNVINVRGQYYTGSAWHYYDVASAFDARNRRVFKSFFDETTTKTAQWFFYYDPMNRLVEVNYTPDTSVVTTYSVFQFFWIDQKLMAYWETDNATGGGSTEKRYVASDETDRPIQLWNWPSTGDATRVWAINPSAWGFDTNILGPSIYQPFLFAGQYQDMETTAYENNGTTSHRPGIVLNGFRTYDPLLGQYLQMDPQSPQTWSSYVYGDSSPIGSTDPTGLVRRNGLFVCSDACMFANDYSACAEACADGSGDGSTGYLPSDDLGLHGYEGLGRDDPNPYPECGFEFLGIVYDCHAGTDNLPISNHYRCDQYDVGCPCDIYGGSKIRCQLWSCGDNPDVKPGFQCSTVIDYSTIPASEIRHCSPVGVGNHTDPAPGDLSNDDVGADPKCIAQCNAMCSSP